MTLKWRSFPAHLPPDGALCKVQRWPLTSSPELRFWEQSTATWVDTIAGLHIPFYFVRLFALVDNQAVPASYAEIKEPDKWRKYPDYKPTEGAVVWYRLMDGHGSPYRGTYTETGPMPVFTEEATGSVVPWAFIVQWRYDV